MSRLVARTNLLIVPLLIALIGDTLQTARAEEEAPEDPMAMAQECNADRRSGTNDCIRYCRRVSANTGKMEQCRDAYNEWKKGQTKPETAGGSAENDATPALAEVAAAMSTEAGVDKVTVMGVRLCGDVVEAGEYLEGQGYKNAAMQAKRLRTINVYKSEGNDNYDFKINYGGPPKRDSIYLMSFHGSFQDGPNLFESEKSKFQQATGIELTCNQYSTGPNQTRLECKYPAGEADRSRPGFYYSIAHQEGQKAFFVDASAWDYEDCG